MGSSIAVVGPGAIGATVAAYLHASGQPVLLCGRTPRERLDVRADDADPIIVPGPVHTDPADVAAPVDAVMLAVKATQIDDAGRWLTALCDEHTVVCVLQNGVEQVELVSPHCPASRVVPAVVWIPAETQPGGWVRLRGQPRLTLPASSGLVADLLISAGCEVTLADDFTAAAWHKLLTNAVAGLMALTGRRSGMFGRDDIAELSRRYVAEGLAVARAEGADLGDDVIEGIPALLARTPEDMGASILADRQAGRPLEWDVLNGVILREARRHGLPAPVSEVVVPLLAAAGEGPG
jgi:2-dehydropantoate 2-reductase